MTVVNWGDMNVGQSAPLVEPGFYQVEVVDYEKTTASTGTEQIKVKHRIVQNDNDSLNGSTLFDFLALSEAALWRIGAFVQGCGMDLKSLPSMELGSEQFWRVINLTKGRRLFLEVTQATNPKSGRQVNKIQSYLPAEDQDPLEYIDNVPSFVKNKLNKSGII